MMRRYVATDMANMSSSSRLSRNDQPCEEGEYDHFKVGNPACQISVRDERR